MFDDILANIHKTI